MSLALHLFTMKKECFVRKVGANLGDAVKIGVYENSNNNEQIFKYTGHQHSVGVAPSVENDYTTQNRAS